MQTAAIEIENPRFHGELLQMIGKTVDKALKDAPGAERLNESGRAQRLVWKEKAQDTESGKAFPLYLMARILDEVIWAVGIWSPRFAFLAEEGDEDTWFFRAVEKLHITNFRHVNWIAWEDGKYVNLGLGE